MINQLPPELFAQRPVRSEFESPKGAPAVTKRRMILFGGIIVILIGSIMVVDMIIGKPEQNDAMIPHIASTSDIKERPEQPGGIDIPHRDVTVFEQLDERVDVPVEPKVEQLLPQAEEPEMDLEASGEEVIASMEKAVSESLEAELNKAAETMAPAVTAADPEVESLLDQPMDIPAADAPKEAVQEKVKDVLNTASPVKAQIKEAVKNAEKTMKVDLPEPTNIVVDKPKPSVKTPVAPVEKAAKVIKKKVKKAVVAPKAVKKDTKPARLPADLFTKGEAAVKASGKTKHVQLGSFRSEDMARKASQVLQKKYSSTLNNAGLNVVRADLGAKGIYYRVMSSSLPEAQAKSICKTLKAAKSPCLLVR